MGELVGEGVSGGVEEFDEAFGESLGVAAAEGEVEVVGCAAERVYERDVVQNDARIAWPRIRRTQVRTHREFPRNVLLHMVLLNREWLL